MKLTNTELRHRALSSLRGNWVNVILAFIIFWMLNGVGAPAIIILGGPLTLGISSFSLAVARNQKVEIEQIFSGFNNFANSLVAYLLMAIFVFLWSLLLIIPGIIKAIAYSQTFFIMSDDSTISGMDAIDKSMAMMNGYKMRYFLLSLLFGLLIVLSGLLLFIPLFWLVPYMYVTFANFYEELKMNQAQIA